MTKENFCKGCIFYPCSNCDENTISCDYKATEIPDQEIHQGSEPKERK